MNISLSVTASFLVTLVMSPIIIKVFKSMNVLDSPNPRKIHKTSTPSFGGIAIFSGVCFGLFLAFSLAELGVQKYFLSAAFLILLLGVRDDLSSLSAKEKLVVQICVAVWVVYFGELKIEGLHGLFGVSRFPWKINELFTVCIIVILTNSFNLIDGIDGLAACIALMISVFFAWCFLAGGFVISAGIATSIAGAVFAFLLYNWFPSRIFMGDTGSMTLGFMLSSLMIKFLQVSEVVTPSLGFESPVAITIALFILPVYDTLRVFVIRCYSGKHPLSADRNHIHHIVLKLGFNHEQATIALVSYNFLVIMGVLTFQKLGDIILITLMGVVTTVIGVFLDWKVQKKPAERSTKISDIKLRKSA